MVAQVIFPIEQVTICRVDTNIASPKQVSVQSSGDDLCCPTAADALDAAMNGCPERVPRGMRNRAGGPQIP